MERRTFVRATVGAGAATVAGCVGGDGDDGAGGGSETTANPDADGTSDGDDSADASYVVSIDIQNTADVGEAVSWSWSIENTGPAGGTGTVRLTGELDGTEEVLVEDTIEIPAGDRIDGSRVDTPDQPGEATITVEAPDGTTETATLTVEDTVDEAAAADRIDTARNELETASETLQRAIHEGDTTLDEAAFEATLDDARTALADAEPVATNTQTAVIEALQSYATFLAQYADAHLTADEAFSDTLVTALETYWHGREQYFGDDVQVQDLETAVDRFDESAQAYATAHDDFTDSRTTAEDARTILDGISRTVIDDFETFGYDHAIDRIEGQIWLTTEFQTFATGLQHGSSAWIHVTDAFIAFDAERWNDAPTHLTNATTAFETAVSTLEEFAFEELDFVLAGWSEALCEIGEGTAAVTHWQTAAEAAQNENWDEHSTELTAGWDRMTTCHED